MHCGDDVSVGGKLLCDANKHLLHAISVSGLNCRIHKGSERLTGAMLDRLTHRVHILEANGESYRLKDAKARLKRR